MADLSATLGVVLDEWQETVLEAAMGERRDGKWASRIIGVSAPRQQGKSQLIVARALAGVLLFDERMIICSAHQTDTAREVFQRLLDIIEENPSVERRVTSVMKAINRESITFGSGTSAQTIKIKARSVSGSRGFSADCLLLDEAQILGRAAWSSILPTMSARENPQAWLLGTPPTPQDDGEVFEQIREQGVSGTGSRMAYLEWSAADDDDFANPETWAKANPAYGTRITREAVEAERSAMSEEQFCMERLGMWNAASRRNPVFGPGFWQAVPKVARPKGVELGALGVAVSIDLEKAAIVGAAALPDEGSLVRSLQHGPRPDDWLVGRIVELQKQHGCGVVIDGKGPAADFIPTLKLKLGKALHIMALEELKDACAGIYKAVRSGDISHACDGDRDEIDDAVDDAVKREVQDRWLWGRRKSGTDISPLEAATLALWGLASDAAKPYTSAYADTDLVII